MSMFCWESAQDGWQQERRGETSALTGCRRVRLLHVLVSLLVASLCSSRRADGPAKLHGEPEVVQAPCAPGESLQQTVLFLCNLLIVWEIFSTLAVSAEARSAAPGITFSRREALQCPPCTALFGLALGFGSSSRSPGQSSVPSCVTFPWLCAALSWTTVAVTLVHRSKSTL